MTRVVLSIGSNIGDRLARLQSVLDALGDTVQAVSPVYETAAWGGVEQGPFLNAVLIADDPRLDGHGWLRRAQEMEQCGGSRARTALGPAHSRCGFDHLPPDVAGPETARCSRWTMV